MAEGQMLLRRVKRSRGLKADTVVLGILDPGLQVGNQLRAPLGGSGVGENDVVVEDLDAFIAGGAML